MSPVLSTKKSRFNFAIGAPLSIVLLWGAIGTYVTWFMPGRYSLPKWMFQTSYVGSMTLAAVIVAAFIIGLVYVVMRWISAGD